MLLSSSISSSSSSYSLLFVVADYSLVVLLVIVGATMASTGGNLSTIQGNRVISRCRPCFRNRMGSQMTSQDAQQLYQYVKQQQNLEEQQRQQPYYQHGQDNIISKSFSRFQSQDSSSSFSSSNNLSPVATARKRKSPAQIRARIRTWG